MQSMGTDYNKIEKKNYYLQNLKYIIHQKYIIMYYYLILVIKIFAFKYKYLMVVC